jgi:hypothetical protein
MAGIQAIVNQVHGSRQGNPNVVYYKLAADEFGSKGNSSCASSLGNMITTTCVFRDITDGDMDVPCQTTNNCYLPSGTYGVLSTSGAAYTPAYAATVGWDFATGLGTVDAYQLVKLWTVAAP